MQEIGNFTICFPVSNETNKSTVYFAQSKMAPIPVAIKFIEKNINNEDNEVNMKLVRREINLMKELDHPNITTLFDVIEDENSIALVLEYAENGSLSNFMTHGKPLPMSHVQNYFSQLCDAVYYLHNDMKIAHRDIKAENILLDSNFNVKLCDFGLSQCSNNLMTTQCGSPNYISPEVIQNKGYNEKTDVWSMGVLLYLMLTGEFPFQAENNSIPCLLKKIVNDPFIPPSSLAENKPLLNLIERMLKKDPVERISINEIMMNQFVSKPAPKKSMSLPQLNQREFNAGSDEIAMCNFENYGLNPKEMQKKIHEGDHDALVLFKILVKRIEEKQRRIANDNYQKKKIPLMNRKFQITGSMTFKRRFEIPRIAGSNKIINQQLKSVFVP